MHARQGRRIAAGAAWAFAIVLLEMGSAGAQPARDAVSDSVGATFGEFRVDETGNANYSIPVYAPPGTAGVAPKVTLSYNSGGGNGWVGKGWAVGGLSAITRCRKTREAGDFLDNGIPVDGNSKPVTYTNQDVFCLDGARLLLTSGTGTYGSDGTQYQLELDPFTKITSYGGDNGTTSTYSGPNFFVVQRKDGSTSYYGNSADSRIKAVACTHTPTGGCFQTSTATWAINRFEDSTGNYIDYGYTIPSSSYVTAGTQYVPTSITWTGKRQLAGQTAAASAPYAGIYFHHQIRVSPAGEDASNGWQGGVYFSQDQSLVGIEVRDQIDTGSPRTLRYYKLSYTETSSGSGVKLLRSLKECRENPDTIPGTACYRPTTFNWSDQDGASQTFSSADTLTTGESRDLVSSRIGDVDGDGRADVVWFRSAGSSHATCPNGNITQVSFGDRQESGGTSKLIVTTPAQATYCTYLTASNGELDTAWALMDFDADGRDDLLVADNNGPSTARWHVYRSVGRPASSSSPVFDTTQDLIGNAPAIPTADDSQEQAQLGDFNGDGMLDFLYPTGPSGLAIRFLQRKSDGSGFEFSGAHTVQVPTTGCGGSCNLSIFNIGVAAFGVAPDLNGDGRSDIVLRVTNNSLLTDPADPAVTYYTQDVLAAPGTDEILGSINPQFYAFVMDERTATTQSVLQYGGVLYSYNSVGPTDARQFQFADFNGDSLPDLLYQPDVTQDDFHYAINRGDGFQRNGVVNAYTGHLNP